MHHKYRSWLLGWHFVVLGHIDTLLIPAPLTMPFGINLFGKGHTQEAQQDRLFEFASASASASASTSACGLREAGATPGLGKGDGPRMATQPSLGSTRSGQEHQDCDAAFLGAENRLDMFRRTRQRFEGLHLGLWVVQVERCQENRARRGQDKERGQGQLLHTNEESESSSCF